LKKIQIFAFLENDPLRENFQNSVQKVFIGWLIDVLWSNFVKFGRREIGKIVGCLLDKKLSPGSPALATARIAPKICHGQPRTMYSECSRFHPNRFTFGGVIPERVDTTKTGRVSNIRLKPIFEPNSKSDFHYDSNKSTVFTTLH